MYRIRLEDGRVIASGPDEICAISDVQLTRCVNPDKELMPGGVCSDMLEVTVLDPQGVLTVAAGSRLTLQKENGAAVGVFFAEKPERLASGQYRLTAYDAVSRLDQDLGRWLFELTGWPYRLEDFARMVCSRCGLELTNSLPINGSYPIGAFSGEGITGRQLMRWVCQLGGCFCRADGQGKLEFGWFRDKDLCLRPTGDGFYYAGSFSGGEYAVCPIQKVQLRLSGEDLGAVYPDDENLTNTLVISGNYLLGNSGAAAMEAAARQLYGRMQGISYTPCQLRTTAGGEIFPGDVIRVEDRTGKELRVYVMTTQEQGGILTLYSTGSARRDSCAALNEQSYRSLTGKVMNLRADVEGLKIENADAKGNLAALELDVDGIRGQVQQAVSDGNQLKSRCSALEQTGEKLELQIKTLSRDGAQRVLTQTGYRFDEEGLRISKAGQQMENLLDNTGMYVRRSGQVILQANSQGVEAADVTVRNYLVIGDHARLEDYSSGVDFNRTACFYLS